MNRYLNVSLSNVSLKWPEWNHLGSFNLGVGGFAVGVLIPERFYRSFPVWLYNAFRRVYADPRHNCWGLGLLQVGGRHLLGIVSNEEEFKIDVGFVHVVSIDRSADSGGTDSGTEAKEGDGR